MSSQVQYLNEYNKNVYIGILNYLFDQLPQVENFLNDISQNNDFKNIDDLIHHYENIFLNEQLSYHIDFKVERIYKALYLRNPGPHDKGNSYYHLTLKLKSDEIRWLDNLYDHILFRLIKFYKHLFSKIDNYFISLNSKQLEKYHGFLTEIKSEIEKVLEFSEHREIISKREKLKDQYLEKIPFGGLFYTTHVNNLGSILDLGILSHKQAHAKKVVNVDISNQQVNKRRNRVEPQLGGNIHEYVPLYINPKNPMLYYLCKNKNREKLVLLKVNPHILLEDNVAFSDGNAAVSTTRFFNNIDDFNRLNWTVINNTYWTTHPDGKRIRCSEVLVKDKIPLYYVSDLYMYNETPLKDILPLYPNHLGIKVNIQKELYF